MEKQNYLIVTDACSDLIPEYAEQEGILVIPMEVSMTDGTTFQATYDCSEMPLSDFYGKVREGVLAQTSAVTPQQYIDYFDPLLKEGNDILCIVFSSGMSSTFGNAELAAKILHDKYPERKLFVVDSLGGTGGQGYHVYFAAKNRDEGMSIEDNAKWVEETRYHINYTWTVSDLMHLNRGGRLSKSSAIIGTALQVKPVGDIDNEGHLVSIEKAHGRKASIHKLADILNERIDPSHPVMVCHCDCPEDAEALKNRILAGGKVSEVVIGRIGPVVGAHLGPSGLTAFYFCDHRS